MKNTPLETEIKIPVADLADVKSRLESLRAIRSHPSMRETNAIFDSEERRMAETGCVLRLRRYGRHTRLTFKGPASFRGMIKERVEHEIEIEAFDTMRAILECLGLRIVFRYEKDRERWALGDITVELDHTPMGDFVELEGPPDRLEQAARSLDLDPNDAVRGSYISLWLDHRENLPNSDLPLDMVFR